MDRVSRGALLACVMVVGMWGLTAKPAFAVGEPATFPTFTVPLDGATVAGDVVLSVTSTAPSVQFWANYFGAGPTPLGVQVPVVAGVASTTWSTWGDGSPSSWHIGAADCNDSGCNLATNVDVVVTNDPPAITSPVDGALTDNMPTFTATSPSPALVFMVDYGVGGFVAEDLTSPFTYTVPTPLADGDHVLSVTECDSTGVNCNGPAVAVNFTVPTLHPTIASVSPNPFSPHPDGRDDTTAFRIHLPDSESVSYTIHDAGSQTVVGPHNAGVLAAGDHTFVWNGKNNGNQIVADGAYTIVVQTTGTVSGIATDGSATAPVTVDDTGSVVQGAGGSGTTFYPVVDGYLDAFGPKVTVNEGGSLWLQVFNSTGALVAQVAHPHATGGTFQVNWNGRNKSNVLAAEGTFQYHFLAQDGSGNRSTSATGVVHLSHKRLVNKSITISRNGKTGGLTTSDPTCTGYSYSLSTFPQGVWLADTCNPATDGFQAIFADYDFAVPAAVRYNTIKVESLGNTINAPEPLAALIYNAKLSKWASVGTTKVGRDNVNILSTYGTVPAASCVNSVRHVEVSVAVPNTRAPEDYDVGRVSIVLSYSLLQ